MKLSEQFDNALSQGFLTLPAVPDYISDNLAFDLRDYQKQAISRFLHYYSDNYAPSDPQTNLAIPKQPHLLWQMATGSGKTLIMAALILEMYKQGYRNFLFFVNSTNILEKTKENFLNSGSKKYQFASRIEIDGQNVEIKQVENFEQLNENAINFKLTTIQGLHTGFQNISENSMTVEDLEGQKIVMLADEAHHLNAGRTKSETAVENTWTNTVNQVLTANSDNRLFDFTATVDWTNDDVANHYSNKNIYHYDLAKFRKDKFSKDVFTLAVDCNLENQESLKKLLLRTIIISHYRKCIASDNSIFCKPVVMFKSKSISDSGKNFDDFNELVTNLTQTQITELFNGVGQNQNDIWSKAVKYFQNRNNHQTLVDELKQDFKVEYNLNINSNTVTDSDQLKLNTLEDAGNPHRAIFAVDMLKEGWDVLNLFDIVRLYDTRDGKWTGPKGQQVFNPGKTTVSEQQLIGRGARYFSFNYANEDKYKRKFDENEAEPLRVLEQLHYHCKNTPEYISELKSALISSGIMAGDDLIEYTLNLKSNTGNFLQKNLFENQKYDKQNLITQSTTTVEAVIEDNNATELPNFEGTADNVIEVKLLGNSVREGAVFAQNGTDGEVQTPNNQPEKAQTKTLNETVERLIPDNIIRHALNRNKNFAFDKLKLAYLKLESGSQFIELFKKQKVRIIGEINRIDNLEREDLLYICSSVLSQVEPSVKQEQKKVYVTKRFSPAPAKNKDRFQKTITRKRRAEGEVGTPQNTAGKDYQLDLSMKKWYVYNENYGTDQEKYFVKWFDAFYEEKLKESGWKDIYLARNDKAVKLYSWLPDNIGEGFEPDFVLFMKKGNIEYCFYIEPKGEHLFELDKWKEEFLADLENVAGEQITEQNNENYRVIGLPFFNNEQQNKQTFEEAFSKKTGF